MHEGGDNRRAGFLCRIFRYNGGMRLGYRAPVRMRSMRRSAISASTGGMMQFSIGPSALEGVQEIIRLRNFATEAEKARQEEFKRNEQQRADEHAAKIREMASLIISGKQKIAALKEAAKGEPGKPGDPGQHAPPVDIHALKSEILAQIPKPQDGESADAEEIALRVMDLIAESGTPQAAVDHEAIKQDIIAQLLDGKTLKLDHVDGLTQTITALKSQTKPGMGYMHGGGITRLTAGTNVTITKLSDGSYRIAASGGGGGFSTLTPTETPNGNRRVFTFAAATAQPSYIIVDNVWMQATSKAGTVNWTWNAGALQATLTIPATDDILAVV